MPMPTATVSTGRIARGYGRCCCRVFRVSACMRLVASLAGAGCGSRYQADSTGRMPVATVAAAAGCSAFRLVAAGILPGRMRVAISGGSPRADARGYGRCCCRVFRVCVAAGILPGCGSRYQGIPRQDAGLGPAAAGCVRVSPVAAGILPAGYGSRSGGCRAVPVATVAAAGCCVSPCARALARRMRVGYQADPGRMSVASRCCCRRALTSRLLPAGAGRIGDSRLVPWLRSLRCRRSVQARRPPRSGARMPAAPGRERRRDSGRSCSARS